MIFSDPTSPDQIFQNAKSAYDSQDYERAAKLSTQVLDISEHPLVANLLAMSLYRLEKFDFAERVFYGGLAMDPDCVPLLANLANYLRETLRTDGAQEMLSRALSIAPDNHQVNHNYAILCLETGRFEEALRYAEKADQIMPNHPATRHTLGMAQFQNGRFDIGPANYEFRKEVFHRDDSPLPLYTGGKHKVIIRQEQGLGDTLMCARWFPKLAKMGADVTLVAPTALYGLLEASGLCKVHRDGDPEEFTHHLWTMDMIRMFGRKWHQMDGKPYFVAPPEQVERFKQALRAGSKPKVGFCWSGSSRTNDRHAFIIDKRRSMTISEAVGLMDGLDVDWVNLTRELGLPGSQDFSAQIGDFAEMAGLLMNLDLVVTVDTALAHLAGGLGVPTVCLHRYDMCWRWHPYTEETPLYSNMKHYRQTRPFDWSHPVQEARSAISGLYN